MSRREIAIVVIMLLGLAYAGYTYLFEGPKEDGIDVAGEAEELTKFVQDAARVLAAGKLTDRETYSIARAEAGWPWNPFHITLESQPEEALAITLLYSGFLAMGGKRMAIINGQEYETGERLPEGDLIVREIHPDRVVVAMEGSKQTLIVPLTE